MVDYENVKYLGGGPVIDLNNANVRAYLRIKGMYPSIAGKIVSNGPYKSVGDITISQVCQQQRRISSRRTRADSLPRNLRLSIRLIASTTGSTVNTFLERK